MTPGSDSSPGEAPSEHARPAAEHRATRRRWLVATPLAFAACGLLFVASAHNSEGTDLRPERYTDLASLVSSEADQVTELNAQVAAVRAETDRLAARVKSGRVRHFQRQAEQLMASAGLTAVTGPGVTVTLSDAPADVINSSTENLNLLVVHQQDIQAVVNAMWRGGAKAVTVQGQRIVTTTGIKCEGNAVQLDGVPYPQPYVITAVGDQAAILQAIHDDDYLAVYREQASQPRIAVGWELETPPTVTAPAYDGPTTLTHATVAR